jgi:transposase InsO family protein
LVTFIDDFSRVTWMYLLKDKSEVFACFKDFYMLITNQFSTHLKTFLSNNSTKYMSKDMAYYLRSNGILHQISYVRIPQQNRVSERKNHDLLEKTRAIMLQMNVLKFFWLYGFLTATYLINHIPSLLYFKNYKFYKLQVLIWHTSRCLDALVLFYHHHNVISLILEPLNAFS